MKKQHRRRIIYIDGTLQGGLITALILLESVMVIAAFFYLRYQYSNLLDLYLYSIHFGTVEDLLLKLLNELVIIIVMMSAINVAALLIANALWGRHLNRIIACFRKGLKTIQSLDLSPKTEIQIPRHDVLDQLELWRDAETKRFRKLIAALSRFESFGTDSKSKDDRLKEVQNALAQLPHASSQ